MVQAHAIAHPPSDGFDARFSQVGCLFFCIGAQKAGTSWLQAYLKAHPEVKTPGAEIKELHYWDTVRPPYRKHYARAVQERLRRRRFKDMAIRLLADRSRRVREREWRTYLAALTTQDPAHRLYADILFSQWTSEKAAGEITPAYALLDQETFAEMAALSDRSKFIFIMRDPVDRLVSAMRFWLRKKNLRATSEALTEHLALTLESDPEMALARSRYEATIARLEAVVPAERISYHFYETFFNQGEIDRLTAFLGVGARPADFDTMVHLGTGKEAVADPAVVARAREVLQPTYEFVAARFAADVPAEWAMRRAAG